MADFNEMMNSLLSDPQSMEILKGLAEQMSDSYGSQENRAPEDNSSQKGASRQSAPSGQASGDTSAFPDFSSFGDIASLIGNLDSGTVSRIAELLKSYNSVDQNKINLLNSLKPYLSEQRSGRVDGAIRMLKILNVASAMGIDIRLFNRNK